MCAYRMRSFRTHTYINSNSRAKCRQKVANIYISIEYYGRAYTTNERILLLNTCADAMMCKLSIYLVQIKLKLIRMKTLSWKQYNNKCSSQLKRFSQVACTECLFRIKICSRNANWHRCQSFLRRAVDVLGIFRPFAESFQLLLCNVSYDFSIFCSWKKVWNNIDTDGQQVHERTDVQHSALIITTFWVWKHPNESLHKWKRQPHQSMECVKKLLKLCLGVSNYVLVVKKSRKDCTF